MPRVGKGGDSVIDYIINNRKGKEAVDKMDRINRTESDHMPLKLTMKKKKQGKKRNDYVKIAGWSMDAIESFKETL